MRSSPAFSCSTRQPTALRWNSAGRERYVEQVYADYVVSNGDLRRTFEQLVGPAHLEAEYLAMLPIVAGDVSMLSNAYWPTRHAN